LTLSFGKALLTCLWNAQFHLLHVPVRLLLLSTRFKHISFLIIVVWLAAHNVYMGRNGRHNNTRVIMLHNWSSLS
jgi:hypothetical protein